MRAPSSLKMLITCAGRGPFAETACGVQVRSLRTADGEVHAADAIFTAATILPMDWFLDGLGLERNETPFASVVAVDQMGRTSHPRIWAAGNLVNPVASASPSPWVRETTQALRRTGLWWRRTWPLPAGEASRHTIV